MNFDPVQDSLLSYSHNEKVDTTEQTLHTITTKIKNLQISGISGKRNRPQFESESIISDQKANLSKRIKTEKFDKTMELLTKVAIKLSKVNQ